jgi:hypothetical protein
MKKAKEMIEGLRMGVKGKSGYKSIMGNSDLRGLRLLQKADDFWAKLTLPEPGV